MKQQPEQQIKNQNLNQQEKTAQEHQTRHTYKKEQTETLPHQPEETQKMVDPQGRRSTQAYYDSEITREINNRQRNNTEQSLPLNLILKHPRMYKQEFSYLHHSDDQRQFLAYCVVNKQSNSGIFSHERFLLLDSKLKELKYFSDIPRLPLVLTTLKQPKEILKLNKTSKLHFSPINNSIGEVVISWLDPEGKKQWHLSMGNKKMVKELGSLMQQIKKDEYSGLREVKRIIAEVDQSLSYPNVNLKETKFISEVKDLEMKKSKLRQSSIQALRFSGKRSSKSEIKPIIYKLPSKHKNIKQSSELIKPSRDRDQPSPQKQVKTIISPQIRQAIELKEEKPQIEIEEIITAVKEKTQEQTPTQKEEEIFPLNQQPQSSLEKLIKRRTEELESLKIQQEPDITHKPITMSKVLVKHIEQQTDEPQPSLKESASPKSKTIAMQPAKERPFSTHYLQNQKMYRTALLQERRQTLAAMSKTNPNSINKHGHPITELTSKSQSYTSKTEDTKQLIIQWLQAKTKLQLASVYSKFVDKCLKQVQNLTENFQDWHLFHKPISQQYTLSEDSIEFTYFLFVEETLEMQMIEQQKNMIREFESNDYLLSCLKFKNNNQTEFGFPLSCIIVTKGLKVFCRASIVSDKISVRNNQIRLKYAIELSQCEKQTKVSLSQCELFQLTVNNRQYLYFHKSNVLPTLNNQIHIDRHYIERFLKQGVIRNSLDLKMIEEHLELQLISNFIKQLEKSTILSPLELIEILRNEGLNLDCLPRVFGRIKQAQYPQAFKMVNIQLLSLLLEQHIRQCIHRFINKKNVPKSITEVLYRQIQDWLKAEKPMLQIMTFNLKRLVKSQDLSINISSISHEYILTSLMLKLGFRIEIKHRMNSDQLETEELSFWKEVEFNEHNCKLWLTHHTHTYHYSNFNEHYFIIKENIFEKKQENPQVLTQQQLEHLLNHSSHHPLQQSFLFKLLPTEQIIKVNHFLAHNHPPLKKFQRPPFSEQYRQLYYNLQYHPTAFVLTSQHFLTDLIGIKWHLKSKNYNQASLQLEEQTQRIFIWCRWRSDFLTQLYDLKGKLHLLTKNETQSMTFCLKSLQLSIKQYGNNCEENWHRIWPKFLRTANTSYAFCNYEHALELYETCCELLEKMNDNELHALKLNKEFIEIYRKKATINLLLCRVDKALSICQANQQVYKRFLGLLNSNKELVLAIHKEVTENNLIILRCLQIQQKQHQLLKHIGFCCNELIQKQMPSTSSNTVQPKLSQPIRHSFIQLTKYSWIAIINSLSFFNSTEFALQEPIDPQCIKNKILFIQQQNHGLYQYSVEQIYKHISNILGSFKTEQEQKMQEHTRRIKIIEGSLLLTKIVETLRTLSSTPLPAKKQKIYEKNSQNSPLLLLQCITQLITYPFAIHIIQTYSHQYNF